MCTRRMWHEAHSCQVTTSSQMYSEMLVSTIRKGPPHRSHKPHRLRSHERQIVSNLAITNSLLSIDRLAGRPSRPRLWRHPVRLLAARYRDAAANLAHVHPITHLTRSSSTASSIFAVSHLPGSFRPNSTILSLSLCSQPMSSSRFACRIRA